MKRFALVFSVIALSQLVFSVAAFAKLPPNIEKEVMEAYPPAEDHRALKNAYYQPDSTKLKGFVVVEKGGIPAERARFFVTFQDYDYRGVVVDLSKDARISTRRGSIYAYLQRGDVMAVVDVTSLGRTIYFKLMSANVYVPEERKTEKHFSRVTLMLGFTFPKDVFKSDDAGQVIDTLAGWIKPFKNVDEAEAYALGIRQRPPIAAPAAAAVEEGASGGVGKAGKGSKASKSGTAAEEQTASKASGGGETAAAEDAAGSPEAARLNALEEKIEAAKKQMEEAESQMKELKKEQKKTK